MDQFSNIGIITANDVIEDLTEVNIHLSIGIQYPYERLRYVNRKPLWRKCYRQFKKNNCVLGNRQHTGSLTFAKFKVPTSQERTWHGKVYFQPTLSVCIMENPVKNHWFVSGRTVAYVECMRRTRRTSVVNRRSLFRVPTSWRIDAHKLQPFMRVICCVRYIIKPQT
jgi:hypothetical protein